MRKLLRRRYSVATWIPIGIATLAAMTMAVNRGALGLGTASEEPQIPHYFVNAGDCGATDWSDAIWESDQSFDDEWGFVGGRASGSWDLEVDDIYRCASMGQSFGYQFELPNGEYAIKLYFLEPEQEPGGRQFDVAIEGDKVLDGFDIAAEAGGTAIGVERSFTVNVEDGRLEINFEGGEEGALVNAIAVEGLSLAEPPDSASEESVEETPTPIVIEEAAEGPPAEPEATEEPASDDESAAPPEASDGEDAVDPTIEPTNEELEVTSEEPATVEQPAEEQPVEESLQAAAEEVVPLSAAAAAPAMSSRPYPAGTEMPFGWVGCGNDLTRCRDDGFTVIHRSYWGIQSGESAGAWARDAVNLGIADNFLNNTPLSLMTGYSVGQQYQVWHDWMEDATSVESPGTILGYYLPDEPQVSDYPKVLEIIRAIHDVDPQAITLMYDAFKHPDDLRTILGSDGVDVILDGGYPVYHPEYGGHGWPYARLHYIEGLFNETGKTVYQTSEGFGQACRLSDAYQRIQSHIAMGILGGAQGVFTYVYDGGAEGTPCYAGQRDFLPLYEQLWPWIMADNKTELTATVTAGPSETPPLMIGGWRRTWKEPFPSVVAWLFQDDQGQLMLGTANLLDSSTVEATIAGVPAGEWIVLEEGRSVTVGADGSLSESWPAMGYHFYVLSGAGGSQPPEEYEQNPTPTVEPTAEPTAEPTVEPTAEPTEEPTAEPTEEPTAEPTEEPTAEPTEEPGGGETPPLYTQYVNVGRCDAVEWDGVTWAASQAYRHGSWGYVGSDYHAMSPGYGLVSDSAGNRYGNDAQYLHRCRSYGTDFGYHFDLPDGEYYLRLRFVEPLREPGKRFFDVLVEDQMALDDFDINTAAGGIGVSTEVTFLVTVTDGQLDVDFVGDQPGSSDGNAIVQAIGVIAKSDQPEEDQQEPPSTEEPPADSGDTEEDTNPETPTADSWYVNAGTCSDVQWMGQLWLADQPYTAGSWGHVGSDYHAVADDVADPVLDEAHTLYDADGQYLHKCQVYGQDFGYQFDVPNGNYEMHLRFAEPLYEAGERWFDVLVEGAVALDDFDVSQAAGGQDIAVERAFIVTVADGQLRIDFVGGQSGSSDPNALLQAISITPADPVEDQTPEPATPEPATPEPATPEPATPNPATPEPATPNPATPEPATPEPDPSEPDNYEDPSSETPPDEDQPADFQPYAQYVNAGRCDAVEWNGVTWAADQAYSSNNSWGWVGNYNARGNRGARISDPSSVRYLGDAQYLHRCRVQGRNFGYRFDVPNGTYQVRLRFAEPRFNPGHRWFDVAIEGQVVLDDFDIAAEAGQRRIVVERTFEVEVTDGQITIDFLGRQPGSQSRQAIVQALGVVAVDTTQDGS